MIRQQGKIPCVLTCGQIDDAHQSLLLVEKKQIHPSCVVRT